MAGFHPHNGFPMSHIPRPRDAARAAFALAALTFVAPRVARAQEPASPVTIHGYLTQGVGRSSERAILGLDTATSTDYRAAALQVRYAISEDDNFLIQFAHRRLGTSLLNGAQADVALDWVFYQRSFGSATAKVGRVPIPRGIYNEIRDVGTILPFYRAPYNFYTEGVESLDGAVVKYSLGLGAGWTTDLNAFAGGWDFRQNSFSATTGQMYVAESRAQFGYGTQLWLNTPVTGVRLGLGGQLFRFDKYDPNTGLTGTATPQDGDLVQASLDATRDRFYVRAEWQRFRVDGKTFQYPAWYAQGGVKLTSRLGLHAQTDRAQINQFTRVAPTVVANLEYEYARDNALGATFAVTPGFVLKAEAHDTRGYNYDRFVSPIGPQAKSRYWLASAAISF